ncbi:MAG: hypothetical protein IJT18_01115 [Oscillospiraceae bacterium]|nr:hypothetical protein [Oscillospiraceae bacterium]
MELRDILREMQHTPWNFYYVCEPEDDPLHEASWEMYRVRREKLDEIGSDICTILLPVGWWRAVEDYDFSRVDRYCDALMAGHPNRKLMPRVKLDPPLDWQRAHPEELCVYWGGPTDAETIRAMVGTALQDFDGYGPNKPPLDQQKIARQSFSSQLWVRDAGKALTELLAHLESLPYADRILGYMPAFGNCGECMWWGDWRNQGDPRRGDFGITHRRLFFEWALEKYGSLDALRSAWHMPDLTAENISVPTPPERWSENGKDLRGVLLADDQRQVDCNAFHAEVCFDAIEAFGKVVKEKTGKAVGCFYGYLQDESVGYAGHLALERAVTTPWVDFYSSPKAYHYSQAGDPGASQAPGQSFARKKLWIEENDLRSHHATAKHRAQENMAQTRTVFWREIYRALTFGQGFWWMDIGGIQRDDWYADPEMVEMFKAQADFYKKWSPVPRSSAAQVLFVEDGESCGHTTMISGVQRGLRYKLERELRLIGAPVDHLLIADLEEMDLSQYRLIVFCHAFVLPRSRWAAIRARLRPDAHIVWNWAAGLLSPDYDPENQKAVTGFSVTETPGRLQPKELYRHLYWHRTRKVPQDYPLLAIRPEAGQEVLQRSPDGHILTARIAQGQGASVFAAELTLRTALLRRLAADAGVTFCAPEDCAVLADDKLIGFFPRYDVCFDRDFAGAWRNVVTGETVTGKTRIALRGKDFAIFEKL